MSNNFSINDVPMDIQDNKEEAEMTKEVVEFQQQKEEGQHVPKVHLENVDAYKLAVQSMREELVKLVQEGFLTEVVAERLMTDFMHNTFNTFVRLKFE